MNDLLKKYIQSNREAFDDAPPPENGWFGVLSNLERLQDSDQMEQYLTANRPLFDSETPPLQLWQDIARALPEGGKSAVKIFMPAWPRSVFRAAASIALLVTGIGIGLWYARSHEKASEGMAMSDISHEYAELEQYYKRDIAGKQVRLSSFSGTQPAEVDEDMDQLDDVMKELRQELAKVPPGNQEQVVRAMIENYKAKAAILQRVLDRLDKIQTETNNSGKKHEIKSI